MGRRDARSGGGGGGAPFTPESLTNLHSWFRADSGVTIVTGVSQWVSRVNGYALTQAIAANQPALTTAAVLNSKEVLNFDGVNDRLTSTAAASVWKFLHDGTGNTVFYAAVSRMTAGGFGGAVSTATNGPATIGCSIGIWGPATNLVASYVTNGSGARTLLVEGASGNITNLASLVDFTYKEASSPEYMLRRTASSLGSGASATAPSAADPSNTLSVGTDGDGTNFLKADIAEIIIYNRELTTAEKTQVYSYLATRYGQ